MTGSCSGGKTWLSVPGESYGSSINGGGGGGGAAPRQVQSQPVSPRRSRDMSAKIGQVVGFHGNSNYGANLSASTVLLEMQIELFHARHMVSESKNSINELTKKNLQLTMELAKANLELAKLNGGQGLGKLCTTASVRWDLKDYFSQHSDLCRHENWFLGRNVTSYVDL